MAEACALEGYVPNPSKGTVKSILYGFIFNLTGDRDMTDSIWKKIRQKDSEGAFENTYVARDENGEITPRSFMSIDWGNGFRLSNYESEIIPALEKTYGARNEDGTVKIFGINNEEHVSVLTNINSSDLSDNFFATPVYHVDEQGSGYITIEIKKIDNSNAKDVKKEKFNEKIRNELKHLFDRLNIGSKYLDFIMTYIIKTEPNIHQTNIYADICDVMYGILSFFETGDVNKFNVNQVIASMILSSLMKNSETFRSICAYIDENELEKDILGDSYEFVLEELRNVTAATMQVLANKIGADTIYKGKTNLKSAWNMMNIRLNNIRKEEIQTMIENADRSFGSLNIFKNDGYFRYVETKKSLQQKKESDLLGRSRRLIKKIMDEREKQLKIEMNRRKRHGEKKDYEEYINEKGNTALLYALNEKLLSPKLNDKDFSSKKEIKKDGQYVMDESNMPNSSHKCNFLVKHFKLQK